MGPFTVLVSDTTDHWEVRDEDGDLVADYVPASDIAKLFAAAPELLSALKDLMALYKQGQLVIEGETDEGDDPVVGAAMSAIAKAEGRGE